MTLIDAISRLPGVRSVALHAPTGRHYVNLAVDLGPTYLAGRALICAGDPAGQLLEFCRRHGQVFPFPSGDGSFKATFERNEI